MNSHARCSRRDQPITPSPPSGTHAMPTAYATPPRVNPSPKGASCHSPKHCKLLRTSFSDKPSPVTVITSIGYSRRRQRTGFRSPMRRPTSTAPPLMVVMPKLRWNEEEKNRLGSKMIWLTASSASCCVTPGLNGPIVVFTYSVSLPAASNACSRPRLALLRAQRHGA